MTATNKLALELLANGAANQTLANTTFAQLNQIVQAGAVDRIATPPGSPANEALYIITATATGAWAGKESQLAYWLTSTAAWQYIVPREGFLVHVNDEDVYYKYTGSAWEVFTGGGISNPMTTAGDIIVGGASGAPGRLAAGTEGYVLTIVSGSPTWQAASASSFAPVVTESTTARTLVIGDAGAYLRHTNASSSTVTIPPQSSVAWGDNTEVHIRRAAAGNLTLTPGSGVTLNAPSGGTLVLTNNMSVTLKRVASDVWDVIGQTVPV